MQNIFFWKKHCKSITWNICLIWFCSQVPVKPCCVLVDQLFTWPWPIIGEICAAFFSVCAGLAAALESGRSVSTELSRDPFPTKRQPALNGLLKYTWLATKDETSEKTAQIYTICNWILSLPNYSGPTIEKYHKLFTAVTLQCCFYKKKNSGISLNVIFIKKKIFIIYDLLKV